jgi:hypothetical protein
MLTDMACQGIPIGGSARVLPDPPSRSAMSFIDVADALPPTRTAWTRPEAAAGPRCPSMTRAMSRPIGRILPNLTRAICGYLFAAGPAAADDRPFRLEPAGQRVQVTDMHGGTGTQAVVVWRDGEVCLGQVTTTFGWPPPHQSSRPCWAFNRALRAVGATNSTLSRLVPIAAPRTGSPPHPKVTVTGTICRETTACHR